jgi:spermidine synthase
MFPSIPEVLPEGQLGLATIRHFEVSEADSRFTALRGMIGGRRDDYVAPGRYAQLLVGRTLMMSDTQMERRSNYEVVRQARGHVFISGLGLGMILHPILNNPEVTQVTVVEKYADVIKLVGPTLPHQEKLTFVEADVMTWKPAKGTKYNVIYHDIWPDITEDNLKDMAILHRRFAHFKAPGGWQDSWKRDHLKALKRQQESRRGGW